MRVAEPYAAVGYIRMSSDDQERSPSQQRQQIIRLAAKHRCKIIRWYEDLAVSGDDIKRRKSFRKMIADASAKRDFKRILCWSQDRFGRFDSLEAGEWIGPLRRADVHLITFAEGEIDWTDTAGRLVYTIQQEGKNAFLLDLARNVARGRCEAARREGFIGGKTPYGYDRVVTDDHGKYRRRIVRGELFRAPQGWTAKLVPTKNRSEIKTIKRIFAAYARGESLPRITYSLNADRIPSPQGRHWSMTTIRGLLRNPVYVGDQVWNRRHSGKYFAIMAGEVATELARCQQFGERVSRCTLNRKEDWVIVRNAHPPLVTRKVWDAAQVRIEKRLGRKFQQPGLPLTGLVVCANCGTAFTYRVRIRKSQANPIAYYLLLCPTLNRSGPSCCQSRVMSEPQLRSFVVDVLTKAIGVDFERNCSVRLAAYYRTKVGRRASRESLCGRIQRLEAKVDRGASNLLVAAPKQVEAASAKLSAWLAELETLREQLALIDASSPKGIAMTVANAMVEVRTLRYGLATKDRALLHHTLQRMVDRIVVDFEPDPKRPGYLWFKSGVMHCRTPFLPDQMAEHVVQFTRDELDERYPRWMFWQVRNSLPHKRRRAQRVAGGLKVRTKAMSGFARGMVPQS